MTYVVGTLVDDLPKDRYSWGDDCISTKSTCMRCWLCVSLMRWSRSFLPVLTVTFSRLNLNAPLRRRRRLVIAEGQHNINQGFPSNDNFKVHGEYQCHFWKVNRHLFWDLHCQPATAFSRVEFIGFMRPVRKWPISCSSNILFSFGKRVFRLNCIV